MANDMHSVGEGGALSLGEFGARLDSLQGLLLDESLTIGHPESLQEEPIAGLNQESGREEIQVASANPFIDPSSSYKEERKIRAEYVVGRLYGALYHSQGRSTFGGGAEIDINLFIIPPFTFLNTEHIQKSLYYYREGGVFCNAFMRISAGTDLGLTGAVRLYLPYGLYAETSAGGMMIFTGDWWGDNGGDFRGVIPGIGVGWRSSERSSTHVDIHAEWNTVYIPGDEYLHRVILAAGIGFTG